MDFGTGFFISLGPGDDLDSCFDLDSGFDVDSWFDLDSGFDLVGVRLIGRESVTLDFDFFWCWEGWSWDKHGDWSIWWWVLWS